MGRCSILVLAAWLAAGLSHLEADDSAPLFEFEKQFSADQAIIYGGHQLNGRLYFDNGKIRSEYEARGAYIVVIIRPDLKKVYYVSDEQKLARERDYDPQKKTPHSAALNPEGKYEAMGPDVAEGYSCDKYKVIAPDNSVTFYWFRDGTIPVKIQTPKGAVFIFQNYQSGPQSASLFEIPSDYKTESANGPDPGI